MNAFLTPEAINAAVERLEESESCRDPFEIVAALEAESGAPLNPPKVVSVTRTTTITITIVTERRFSMRPD